MPKTKTVEKIPVKLADPYLTHLFRRILRGKRILKVQRGKTIFTQGDRSDAVFFIQSGKVKVTVVSEGGKEAVIAMLGPHDLLGEGALARESRRISTATALEASTVFRIEKGAMTQALLDHGELAATFITVLLERNKGLEEDLCDQLFNHSEKRLARVLLKLVRLHEHNVSPDATIPLVSHLTLAEMVGTTRSRITHFMNKFRKMGLIDYNGELTVKTERLTDVVLHD